MSPERRRPAGPTRRELVQGIARELELAGLESARGEAERLVAAALELPRSDLVTGGGVRIAPEDAVRIASRVSRRLKGEPLQHIEGTVEFRTIELVSDGRALIPRPETEQLVDLVAVWARDRRGAVRALDIGTGSGALALALLEEGMAQSVVALDLSPAARAQAAENAARLGTDGLELRACPPDIWSALADGEAFDLVVSNPPYIPTEEWRALDPVVRDREPRMALDGGSDGLDIVRRVIEGAPSVLAAGGALFLEIGSSQGSLVLELLTSTSGLRDARLDADLTGRVRFASAIATGGSGPAS